MSGPEHKTLFVVPGAAEAPARARPEARSETDRARPRRMAIAGAAGAAGVAAALVVTPVEPAPGPGPLTPSHRAARLTCESCHGSADPGDEGHTQRAAKACVTCHGEHASTRDGHRALAASGKLGCVTCHTIHGPQGGVRLPRAADAVRYGTRGERTVPGVRFESGEDLVVPVIDVKACLGCHQDRESDPLSRCRSDAVRGATIEPNLCFDEHRLALPPDGARPPGRRPAVCADQHLDDRAFAWEAARAALLAEPEPPRGADVRGGAGRIAGWGGLAAIFGWVGAGLAARRAGRTAATPAPALPRPAERKRLPVVDTSTCLGCYACVDACPYDVLAIEKYVAVVVRPDACCGLVLCEQRCPNGSLRMSDGEAVEHRPQLGADLESPDVPGVFLAGDVTGLPLIKNAILQGSLAADRAHAQAARGPAAPPGEDVVDVCVVGAGPAGISAGLRLAELAASFVVLEQAGVAQSIQSFPRGKLVFDQPLDLPLHGPLWLEQSTKEELLSAWMRILRKARLPLREHTRVDDVVRRPDGLFEVRTVPAEGEPGRVLARTLLLAIGQRGTPRPLPVPVPPEAESRIHYHLADARSLAGQRVVVVGLGDAAMEAAVALSSQPRTSVTIVARAATYTRGQSRNVSEVERLRRKGRLTVLFSRDVRGIEPGRLTIGGGPGERDERLPFDALFVLIGGVPGWDLLRKVGVRAGAASPPATPLPAMPLLAAPDGAPPPTAPTLVSPGAPGARPPSGD